MPPQSRYIDTILTTIPVIPHVPGIKTLDIPIPTNRLQHWSEANLKHTTHSDVDFVIAVHVHIAYYPIYNIITYFTKNGKIKIT